MQEIITAFGIDWKLIVIQLFNFTLLLALLWYFLYKPVLGMLDARQKKIAQGVEDAEAAHARLTQADEEKAGIVRTAHTEAEAIVKRAEVHATEKGSALLADVQTKSERLLAEAAARAQELEERTRKESEDEIARLAILSAEKILRTNNN